MANEKLLDCLKSVGWNTLETENYTQLIVFSQHNVSIKEIELTSIISEYSKSLSKNFLILLMFTLRLYGAVVIFRLLGITQKTSF